jgi:hypothetical protein
MSKILPLGRQDDKESGSVHGAGPFTTAETFLRRSKAKSKQEIKTKSLQE